MDFLFPVTEMADLVKFESEKRLNERWGGEEPEVGEEEKEVK